MRRTLWFFLSLAACTQAAPPIAQPIGKNGRCARGILAGLAIGVVSLGATCFAGNALSRLRYPQMFIPRLLDQVRRNHPAGADTLSWRY